MPQQYLRITNDELKNENVGIVGVIAQAVGVQSPDEIFFDEYWDPKYTLDGYDYEAEQLRRDNERGNVSGISPAKRKKMFASDLLAGAWLALNEPEIFEQNVEELRQFCAEHEHEASMDCAPEGYPEDLANRLSNSLQSYMEDGYSEYLHGDRSNDGLLDLASKLLTGERGNVDVKNDTLYVSYDPETIPQEYETEIDQYEKKPSIKTLIVERLLLNSQHNQRKEEQRQAERRAERERVEKYQAEQKAEAQKARIARLEAMKRK